MSEITEINLKHEKMAVVNSYVDNNYHEVVDLRYNSKPILAQPDHIANEVSWHSRVVYTANPTPNSNAFVSPTRFEIQLQRSNNVIKDLYLMLKVGETGG
jgi:hypothetical protein